MKVVVASNNPVKRKAAEDAFQRVYPDAIIDITCVGASSEVSDQPTGDEETRIGAINRAKNAAQKQNEGDFWVGMEGGIEVIENTLFAFAWMAVLNSDGQLALGRTTTLPLPPSVLRHIEQGMELGQANDLVFGTHNSKQAGGAFGLLTDNRYTRQGIYAQTLEIALIPFVNGAYRSEVPG